MGLESLGPWKPADVINEIRSLHVPKVKVAVTDVDGGVLVANPAFLKLVQATTEGSVRGRPLSDWLSLPNEPFSELLARVGGP